MKVIRSYISVEDVNNWKNNKKMQEIFMKAASATSDRCLLLKGDNVVSTTESLVECLNSNDKNKLRLSNSEYTKGEEDIKAEIFVYKPGQNKELKRVLDITFDKEGNYISHKEYNIDSDKQPIQIKFAFKYGVTLWEVYRDEISLGYIYNDSNEILSEAWPVPLLFSEKICVKDVNNNDLNISGDVEFVNDTDNIIGTGNLKNGKFKDIENKITGEGLDGAKFRLRVAFFKELEKYQKREYAFEDIKSLSGYSITGLSESIYKNYNHRFNAEVMARLNKYCVEGKGDDLSKTDFNLLKKDYFIKLYTLVYLYMLNDGEFAEAEREAYLNTAKVKIEEAFLYELNKYKKRPHAFEDIKSLNGTNIPALSEKIRKNHEHRFTKEVTEKFDEYCVNGRSHLSQEECNAIINNRYDDWELYILCYLCMLNDGGFKSEEDNAYNSNYSNQQQNSGNSLYRTMLPGMQNTQNMAYSQNFRRNLGRYGMPQQYSNQQQYPMVTLYRDDSGFWVDENNHKLSWSGYDVRGDIYSLACILGKRSGIVFNLNGTECNECYLVEDNKGNIRKFGENIEVNIPNEKLIDINAKYEQLFGSEPYVTVENKLESRGFDIEKLYNETPRVNEEGAIFAETLAAAIEVLGLKIGEKKVRLEDSRILVKLIEDDLIHAEKDNEKEYIEDPKNHLRRPGKDEDYAGMRCLYVGSSYVPFDKDGNIYEMGSVRDALDSPNENSKKAFELYERCKKLCEVNNKDFKDVIAEVTDIGGLKEAVNKLEDNLIKKEELGTGMYGTDKDEISEAILVYKEFQKLYEESKELNLIDDGKINATKKELYRVAENCVRSGSALNFLDQYFKVNNSVVEKIKEKIKKVPIEDQLNLLKRFLLRVKRNRRKKQGKASERFLHKLDKMFFGDKSETGKVRKCFKKAGEYIKKNESYDYNDFKECFKNIDVDKYYITMNNNTICKYFLGSSRFYTRESLMEGMLASFIGLKNEANVIAACDGLKDAGIRKGKAKVKDDDCNYIEKYIKIRKDLKAMCNSQVSREKLINFLRKSCCTNLGMSLQKFNGIIGLYQGCWREENQH